MLKVLRMENKSLNLLPIIEAQVTYLEMVQNPSLQDINLGEYLLIKEQTPSLSSYLEIYREVGRNYIWNYRPGQTSEEIEKIIQSPNTRLYYLSVEDKVVGMAELYATTNREIEIVHFGLIPEYLDKGIGKKFLKKVLFIIWQTAIDRVWLSTCSMDHEKAIGFYQKAGFRIFKSSTAKFKDYRFNGFYDMSDAPQIPYGTFPKK